MWLNYFPVKNGDISPLSPHAITSGQTLQYPQNLCESKINQQVGWRRKLLQLSAWAPPEILNADTYFTAYAPETSD